MFVTTERDQRKLNSDKEKSLTKKMSSFIDEKYEKLNEIDDALNQVKKNVNNAQKLNKEVQAPQNDISASPKVRAEIAFNYRIREDFSHGVIGESGSKSLLITPENYKKIGTIFFNKVIKALDINYFSAKKGESSLKFYLECDFQLGNTPQTFRIYFSVNEGKFTITGWSYNQNVSTATSLKELDIRLSRAFEMVYSV